jgi:hypothetical protein
MALKARLDAWRYIERQAPLKIETASSKELKK